MKKIIFVSLLALFILLLSAHSSYSGEYSPDYLIIPGKSVGPIEIGKPISGKVFKMFGKPTSYSAPSPGKKGIDTGSCYWKDRINVKLNDGKGDKNVYQLFIMSQKYYTSSGIRIGSSFRSVKKAYPRGKKEEGMDVDIVWKARGIFFGIYKGKVINIGVFKTSQ